MQAFTLSGAALVLLRRLCDDGYVDVTPQNRPAYRELAEAGIMMPMSGLVGGKESSFRFTPEGWERREEWLDAPAPRP